MRLKSNAPAVRKSGLLAPLDLSILTILGQCRRLPALTSAGGLLLTSLGAHAQGTAPAQTPDASSQGQGLEEIVVTAQRRTQSVLDVPYNISAVNAATIENAGADTLNELTRVVAGLTTVDEGPGARGQTNNLTLRGLRTDSPGGGQTTTETPGQTVNSVSTYFGETPVFFPMPMYDVDRVEVLRGPQGTLYGSGAEAGTIRFIPNRPQFDKFSGEVQVAASAIDNAGEPNNLNRDLKGILNLPLAEHLALRLVAGVEHDGGFIKNDDLLVTRGGSGINSTPIPSIPGNLASGPVIAPLQRDTNTTNQWFARGALRWQPVEAFDLQVDYLHQYIYSANTQYSNPEYPGGVLDFTSPNAALPPSASNPSYWPHSSFSMNPGGTYTSTAFLKSPYGDVTNLVSAVATVDVGMATVTSATSYYTDKSYGISDWTGLIDNPATVNYNLYYPYNNYPRIVTPAYVPAEDHAFVQELRLVSAGTHRFDYVLGAYYNRQPADNGWLQLMPGISAYNASIGQPNPSKFGDTIWNYNRSTLFQDRAVFGELTLHATSAWQITGGVRFFRQTFSTDATSNLYFCGAICAGDQINPNGTSTAVSSSDFGRHVWKFNSSYDFGPGLRAYVTYSEGFRRGGANGLPTAGIYASLPNYLTYTPDLAKNYEVGIKGALLDRKLTYTADVYRIDLQHFQFDAINLSGEPATYNGDTARSQGVELELDASLTRNTRATLGYAYTDAKVTKTFTLYDYPSYALVPSLGGTGETAPLFGGPITAGSKLPGVPQNTITVGIDHTLELALLPGDRLTLHMDGAYHSSESANIVPSSVYNWHIPWNFLGDLRATLDTGGHLSYSVFINNFTNDPGYSGGTNYQATPSYGGFRFVATPRTFGFVAKYQF
jgi:outer membrane receptor protein involved in Fe transport